ncbi:MAG: GNAT family N-acetyltransferase [Bacteroidales bacterium]
MMNIKQITNNEDLIILRNLALEIFPHTYKPILSQNQIDYMMHMMYHPETLRGEFDSKNQIFYLIQLQNIPVGYFAIEYKSDKALLIIQKLYLLPGLQGQGLGKRVMNQIIYIAQDFKASVIRLYVNRYNEAKHFYLNYGFKIAEERDNPIGEGYFMNDYIMEYSL